MAVMSGVGRSIRGAPLSECRRTEEGDQRPGHEGGRIRAHENPVRQRVGGVGGDAALALEGFVMLATALAIQL